MTISFEGRVAIVTGAGGGLGRADARELARRGASVVVNDRMTEDIFPPELLARFAPEAVAPAALFLVSEDAPTNAILGAGAGVFQAAYVTLTPGVALRGEECTVEGVAENWDRIADRTLEIVPQSGAEQAMRILKTLQDG